MTQMEHWRIRKLKGISNWRENFNMLAHIHNSDGYKGEWVRCKWTPERGWWCIRCRQVPPEEWQFVAELSNCIHTLDDI